ncbi:MAG: Mur ligase family protein, partial [Thermoguttaceae bacterium]
PGDVAVGGCACDPRIVRPGDLLAAMPEDPQDASNLIAEAIRRGCAAVLTDQPAVRDLVNANAVPLAVVPNVRESFARACQALAGNPSQTLKTIGVVGRNGKTSASCLIAGMLHAADCQTGIVGSLGYLDGRTLQKASEATPSPERLAPLMARMIRNGCSHAVVELSSRAVDQSRLAGVEFDAVCITNSTRARHQATIKLLGQLRNGSGFAVINADDPGSAGYIRELTCPVLTVGLRSAAEVTATPIDQCLTTQTFLITAGSQSVAVETPMIGRQHIYHFLATAAVGLGLGIDLTTSVRGMEYAGQVPGELERIECGQPFGVFVDGARTAGSLARALKTLRDVSVGRLICVFSRCSQRESDERHLIGRTVEQHADVALATSDEPRDRKAAIRRAIGMAASGDCVLIAGRGRRTQSPGKRPLDDREVAKDCLYSGQWAVGSRQ